MKTCPVHGYPRLVGLDDVPDAHGGHVDHDQGDVPVGQLLGRLREQQGPLVSEVRHTELDQVSDMDPAHLLHGDLVALVDEPVVGLHEPVPAAVRPPGSRGEGGGTEVDSGQGQESHNRLVVVSKTLFY